MASISDSNLFVLLGKGDGTFQAPTTLTLSGAVATFVLVADFNANHKLDVAITMQGGVDVLFGNGDGTFETAAFTSYNSPNTPAYLASGDFNADGKLDLVSADSFDNNVTLLLRGTELLKNRFTFPSLAPLRASWLATSIQTRPRTRR